MDIIDIIFLLILWGSVPVLYVIKYLKLNFNERVKAKQEFKNPSTYFVDGIKILGVLVFFSGIIMSVNLLKHTGAIIFIISWFSTGIELLNSSRKGGFLFISTAIISFILCFFVFIYPSISL